MNLDLPYTLTVDGEEKAIHCDFRDIITILTAFNDPEIPKNEKMFIMLNNLYADDFLKFRNIDEATKQALWFIDWGKEYKETENRPRLMDWEQDYNLIVSSVNNKVDTTDIRDLAFLHWWTFLGYLSDRGDCQFSAVTEIRDKLAKGRKLEKWEREILRENHDIIIIKDKQTEELEKELWGD